MEKLIDHIVPGDSANHQLTIEVLDGPGQGGACHYYGISGFNIGTNASNLFADGETDHLDILFQNGPIKEFGVNGITQEALLAIVIHRLRSFQVGPYACKENEEALAACEDALKYLQVRTIARIKRNVEGTHIK